MIVEWALATGYLAAPATVILVTGVAYLAGGRWWLAHFLLGCAVVVTSAALAISVSLAAGRLRAVRP